jgi:phosphatidylethanolamine/phosphatidyl-N-methylethanolamine N-methyltransferase
MMRRLSEYRLFLGEFWRNFHTTGAILPSGRRLAAALARYVGQNDAAQKILEVGPGTGAVTRHIVRAMAPEDRLDLVELNPNFAERLRSTIRTDPVFRSVEPRARVFETAIEDLAQDAQYDVIVSGLPLNNFSAETVRRILAALAALLAPGGTLSFFEYIAVRRVKMAVSRRSERERLRGVDRVLRELLGGSEIRRDWVLANVPPAWVHHVRLAQSCPKSQN